VGWKDIAERVRRESKRFSRAFVEDKIGSNRTASTVSAMYEGGWNMKNFERE